MYSNIILFMLAAVGLVVFIYLLYLSRKLIMWWTGVSELIANQERIITILGQLADDQYAAKTHNPLTRP